jgi:hypothetical protein
MKNIQLPFATGAGTVVLGIALLVAACGGGSGGSGTTPPPSGNLVAASCTVSGARFAVAADATATVGKAAGAYLQACGAESPGAIKWTQTAGPALPILADRMQAVSVEPTAAGTYTFDVSFSDAQGVQRNGSVSVAAGGAPTTSAITARVDQSVFGGSDVSLRAWPILAAGDSVASVTWSQLSGPAMTLTTGASDPTLAQFVAPTVTTDTPMQFRVTLRTAAGTTDTDDVWVMVQRQGQAPVTTSATFYPFDGVKVSPVHAYKPAGKYAALLANCVYTPGLQINQQNIGDTNLCTFAKLPLLGGETAGQTPTVEQVMDRVVVSHDWMGANFESFLREQDTNGDWRRLLNGVTAVVIGSHVRPSFYYAFSGGAIYLDADNVWLTPAQRDVINEAPDYRSDFGKDLQFAMPAFFTKNNLRVPTFAAATQRVTRTTADLVPDLGDLLYHELAHANDFFPPSTYATLAATATTASVTLNRSGAKTLGSDVLNTQLPLGSAQMKAVSQVSFQGATADAAQKAFTPTDIAGFFSADRATDQYNYSTIREDFAMLHEEFMMLYRHGITRNVAVTGQITATSNLRNLIVSWGQRGRIADPAIKPRLKVVLGQMAPAINATAVDALPAPVQMVAGKSLFCNLDPATAATCSSAANALSMTSLDAQYRSQLEMRAITRKMQDREWAHNIQERFAQADRAR